MTRFRAKTLIEYSIAAAEGDEVWVALRGNDVLFKSGNGAIVSQLVEGRFPKVTAAESSIPSLMVKLNVAYSVPCSSANGTKITFQSASLTTVPASVISLHSESEEEPQWKSG